MNPLFQRPREEEEEKLSTLLRMLEKGGRRGRIIERLPKISTPPEVMPRGKEEEEEEEEEGRRRRRRRRSCHWTCHRSLSSLRRGIKITKSTAF